MDDLIAPEHRRGIRKLERAYLKRKLAADLYWQRMWGAQDREELERTRAAHRDLTDHWQRRSRALAIALARLGVRVPLENPPDVSMALLAEALEELHPRIATLDRVSGNGTV